MLLQAAFRRKKGSTSNQTHSQRGLHLPHWTLEKVRRENYSRAVRILLRAISPRSCRIRFQMEGLSTLHGVLVQQWRQSMSQDSGPGLSSSTLQVLERGTRTTHRNRKPLPSGLLTLSTASVRLLSSLPLLFQAPTDSVSRAAASFRSQTPQSFEADAEMWCPDDRGLESSTSSMHMHLSDGKDICPLPTLLCPPKAIFI